MITKVNELFLRHREERVKLLRAGFLDKEIEYLRDRWSELVACGFLTSPFFCCFFCCLISLNNGGRGDLL